MFRNKTVFVLGAGASHEAGMPLGSQLAERISNYTDFRWEDGRFAGSNSDFLHFLTTNSANIRLAPAMSRGIRFSNSIDEYIDRHKNPDIERLGKLAIAYSILEAERSSKLAIDDKERYNSLTTAKTAGTWYLEFARMLFRSTDKQSIGDLFANLSIIDFNYDRCLDHFFRYAIRDSYDIQTLAADRELDKLVHLRPYGSIGTLRTETAVNGVPFGIDARQENIEGVVAGLKTYTEQVDTAAATKIKEEFASAHTVVFLGFGFHEQNMRLLTPRGSTRIKRVLATAKGVSEDDQRIIKDGIELIAQSAALDPRLDRVTIRDLSCAELFQEYRLTLQAA